MHDAKRVEMSETMEQMLSVEADGGKRERQALLLVVVYSL